MGRHKKPDKLTMDSNAALAANMSYGKWMAMHGNSPKPKPTIEPIVEEEEPLDPERIKVCKHCGKEYIRLHNSQKYCNPICQQKANYHYVKKGYAHGKSKAAGNE